MKTPNPRKLRQMAGVTQTVLARATGIDRSRLSLIESGQIKPTEAQARKIKKVLARVAVRRAAELRDAVDNEASQACA
jgi:transcriptional regulator with XRE-family HTH domain